MKQKHWVESYIDSLLELSRSDSGIDFDTAARLLQAQKLIFDADMSTALRMFHLYPHLFEKST